MTTDADSLPKVRAYTSNAGTGASADQVQGNVAAAATDAGNPVKVGAPFNSTLPTYTNGQRGDLQINNRGSLHTVILGSGNTQAVVANVTDANAGASILAAGAYGFNGSTWDRLRSRGTGILQVEESYSFLNIAAGQATTTVKSGAGNLHSLVLNSAATATNTTTIYDNTAASGTVIAIPAVTTATIPVSLIFDIAFATGLTVITATANGGNMTFCFR